MARLSVRHLAFSAEIQQQLFRVKAEDVDMAKLAGGVYLRATRRANDYRVR